MHLYSKGYCRGQKKLYRAILKYGWDNFIQEVLFQAECSDACLNRLEILFVDQYRSYEKGLNMTRGGGGSRGYKASSEARAKISVALKGKPKSPEHKSSISIALKGRPKSLEHVAKVAVAKKANGTTNKGKKFGPHSPERVANMSAALMGVGSKPISQYTKEGEWIRNWSSTKEASEVLGIGRGSISNCLTGRLKTAGGYVWKYA